MRFNDEAFHGRMFVGGNVADVGREQNEVEQFRNAGAFLTGNADPRQRAAEAFQIDAVFKKRVLRSVNVGTFFIYFRKCHDTRNACCFDSFRRFNRLRFCTVFRRDNEDRNVGGGESARAHRGEGFMAGRVEKGDRARAACRITHHFVRGKPLCDAARLAGDDIRLAQVIEQGRFTVIDVSHDRNHRRARR